MEVDVVAVQSLMADHGYTASMLAKVAGVSLGTINRFCHKGGVVTGVSLQKVGKALGVRPSALLLGSPANIACREALAAVN